MKLAFCESCGDLVAPVPRVGEGRRCECGAVTVWWDDPSTGRLAVHSTAGERKVSGVGIHNDLLSAEFTPTGYKDGVPQEFGAIQADRIRRMVADCPGSYLFAQVKSLVIRFRIGFTKDTRFASAAEAEAAHARLIQMGIDRADS